MSSRGLRTIRLRLEQLEERLVPSSYTTSTNWSGYAVSTSRGAVSAVSGSWVVPPVTGSGTKYSSAWVGIDGWSSGTVEQIGTDSDTINGVPTYYAWYEMYPAYSINIPRLAIHPGDTINASVTYTGTGSYFALKLTDVTTGGSFSTTQKLPGSQVAQRSSAEWIQEAPSDNRGVLSLSNFGTVKFFNATATIGGTTGPIDNRAWNQGVFQTDMTNNAGTTIAKTSGLTDSAGGSSFTVTYVPTAAPAARPQRWWWSWYAPEQGASVGDTDAATTSASGTSTQGAEMQNADVQVALQALLPRQALTTNAGPVAANNVGPQQFDTAMWSRLGVVNGRLVLEANSIATSGHEEAGDSWLAGDGLALFAPGPDVQPDRE
jgi:hypothetical protein